VEEMKEVFACFDKDSSGAVTTAELALVLKSMNKNYTEAELKKIIGKFDVNGMNRETREHEACDSARWSHGKTAAGTTVQRDRATSPTCVCLHVGRIHP